MEDAPPEPTSKKSSSKDKKNANGDAKISAASLSFKISNKVPYKTVLKGIVSCPGVPPSWPIPLFVMIVLSVSSYREQRSGVDPRVE